MARRCFFSFHYKPDSHRVSQVRQIGTIEWNRPATDNDWETITSRGDPAIEKWIAEQMEGKTCTVVLVGSNTANRKWINHEIIKSWDKDMGVVGIYIHGLKNMDGKISTKGKNPFDYITHGPTKKKLSSIVKCYNPAGTKSKERYVRIPVNPATDSGVIRPLVRAKRRCSFIISPCGRNESREIYVFSWILL